jgi:NADH dehydrogenase (ubiquinone) 1 alpha subcomplex subunit 9
MKYSDIVINATGREYETRNFKFHDINVKGPANLARMAREMGVKRFVHISSINAKENPQTLFLPGGSEWLKTKWQGEMAVLEEFPDATIFRPVEMYGSPDHLVQ